MALEKLPKKKVEIINCIISGSPNFIEAYPWLSIHPCKPCDLFENPTLLDKSVAAAVTLSGGALYSCDIIRIDGELYDTDRYLLSGSGSVILKNDKIEKNFPEHHSEELPEYYQQTI